MKPIKLLSSIFLLTIAISSCAGQIPKADLKFPDNKSVVEIPFTRYRGWIIIQVSVNDTKPRPFILDTGAPLALIANAGLKTELNLNVVGNIIVAGADNNKSKSVPLANNVKFKIGDIVIENGLVALGAAAETISGVDGVIGKYLFDDAVVAVNWKDNKLILTKPAVFSYQGQGEILPIHLLSSGHICTEIEVEKNGKKVKAKADVDLGNRSYFDMDKGIAAPLLEKENKISNIIVSFGANGPARGDITRTNLDIGSLQLKEVITAVSTVNKTLVKDSLLANMGISILERFNLIFDYTHSRLILEKNDEINKDFNFSRSGIILSPKKDSLGVLIADIVPKSAAQENGLLMNDRMISLNGKNVKEISFDEIDRLLKGETADSLEVVVLRNNKQIT